MELKFERPPVLLAQVSYDFLWLLKLASFLFTKFIAHHSIATSSTTFRIFIIASSKQ